LLCSFLLVVEGGVSLSLGEVVVVYRIGIAVMDKLDLGGKVRVVGRGRYGCSLVVVEENCTSRGGGGGMAEWREEKLAIGILVAKLGRQMVVRLVDVDGGIADALEEIDACRDFVALAFL
jgi:hypothetical protein